MEAIKRSPRGSITSNRVFLFDEKQDQDPYKIEKLDPVPDLHPHLSEKLNPDPHESDADPLYTRYK